MNAPFDETMEFSDAESIDTASRNGNKQIHINTVNRTIIRSDSTVSLVLALVFYQSSEKLYYQQKNTPFIDPVHAAAAAEDDCISESVSESISSSVRQPVRALTISQWFFVDHSFPWGFYTFRLMRR